MLHRVSLKLRDFGITFSALIRLSECTALEIFFYEELFLEMKDLNRVRMHLLQACSRDPAAGCPLFVSLRDTAVNISLLHKELQFPANTYYQLCGKEGHRTQCLVDYFF